MSAPALRSLASRQFVLFVAAGGVAALVHWGSRIALNLVVDFRVALVIAYAIGIATAFVLNKWLVFPASGRALAGEIRYFVLFNLAAFPLVWGTAVILAEAVLPGLGMRVFVPEAAHAVAIAVPLVLNFYLHKLVTFREPSGAAR